jgi:hypothetical protein
LDRQVGRGSVSGLGAGAGRPASPRFGCWHFGACARGFFASGWRQ